MDTNNVSTGKPQKGGAIYKAPVGTELPESAASILSEEFKNLGYINEEGLVNSNSPSNNSVKAWGGDVVINMQEDKPDTFKFTMIEAINVEVLKSVYGEDNVTVSEDGEIKITANSNEQKEYSWIVDMIMKGGILKRIVIPKASVTSVGDVSYLDTKPIGYATTISALPDKNGNTHYEYIKK